MNHREEVFGEFVVTGDDAPEVFELAEEAFDQITLAIEPLAEAWLPFAIGFGWDVGHCVLGVDQVADAIGIVGFVGQNDGARIEAIEQAICGWRVMCLPSSQAEPDREALGIDDGMDFGRETTSGATETMISIPLFAVAAC